LDFDIFPNEFLFYYHFVENLFTQKTETAKSTLAPPHTTKKLPQMTKHMYAPYHSLLYTFNIPTTVYDYSKLFRQTFVTFISGRHSVVVYRNLDVTMTVLTGMKGGRNVCVVSMKTAKFKT
jgi:hypothetical protein